MFSHDKPMYEEGFWVGDKGDDLVRIGDRLLMELVICVGILSLWSFVNVFMTREMSKTL